LLPIKGVISDSSSYIKYIKPFFKNNDIKAILLVIESPGGAAGSAEAIANEITFFKKKYPKPIIALSENICTSGAYLIACTSDYIIAPHSALIGSIGTAIPNQFKLKDFLEQLKISYKSITTGQFKDATDPFAHFTQDQIAHLEGLTKDSYQHFIEHVANNRKKVLLATASDWANGKLFTAGQAQKIGLIDEVGSWSNALAYLKKVALIEGKIEWIRPPKEMPDLLSYLTGSADEKTPFSVHPLEGALRNMAQLFFTLLHKVTIGHIF
jgi:protease-4